jgi:hypothetical protein
VQLLHLPLFGRKRFRAREADDVVDEIEALLRDYGPHPLFSWIPS